MSVRELSFDYVEKKVRKKKFGFLGTITPEGRPHVAGIMYAVSPPHQKLYLSPPIFAYNFKATQKFFPSTIQMGKKPFIVEDL
ncbi:MAG: hypothetical protein ACTSQI_21475 [Candidatus Helarchaeota archaeon]